MTHAYPDPRAELRAAAVSQFRSGLQLSELTIALLEAPRRPVSHARPARVTVLRAKAIGRLRRRQAS